MGDEGYSSESVFHISSKEEKALPRPLCPWAGLPCLTLLARPGDPKLPLGAYPGVLAILILIDLGVRGVERHGMVLST